jgi:hypothetical protein
MMDDPVGDLVGDDGGFAAMQHERLLAGRLLFPATGSGAEPEDRLRSRSPRFRSRTRHLATVSSA